MERGRENARPSAIKSFKGRYRFLSNFYPCEVLLDGLLYNSSEHAYQAAKTLDTKSREQILRASGPGKAKRLGRGVVLRGDWEDIKIPVMHQIVLVKFAMNPGLRTKLLATGDVHLEEGNTWGDTFWGTVDGDGENWLGRVLMNVRDQLWD